jgi:hypothetical protein
LNRLAQLPIDHREPSQCRERSVTVQWRDVMQRRSIEFREYGCDVLSEATNVNGRAFVSSPAARSI